MGVFQQSSPNLLVPGYNFKYTTYPLQGIISCVQRPPNACWKIIRTLGEISLIALFTVFPFSYVHPTVSVNDKHTVLMLPKPAISIRYSSLWKVFPICGMSWIYAYPSSIWSCSTRLFPGEVHTSTNGSISSWTSQSWWFHQEKKQSPHTNWW